MIVFDLRCDGGHVFEAWFGSSGDFDQQKATGLLTCPLCGDAAIEKAVMAPNVGAKGNASARNDAGAGELPIANRSPQEVKAMLGQLAKAQAAMLEKSEWVGRDFSTRARQMHDGEIASAPIHGQVTESQAKSLIDDGVPVAPLPFPVVPPEAQN